MKNILFIIKKVKIKLLLCSLVLAFSCSSDNDATPIVMTNVLTANADIDQLLDYKDFFLKRK